MRPNNNRISPGLTCDFPDGARPGIPVWKRLLDLSCILLVLPVAGPLLLMIAIGIKILSRGPVLFRQPRIGYRGKPFTCFKFRSMRADANTRLHEDYFKQLMHSKSPMTKLDSSGDRRLIPLGILLRASGLDELPQLFNVLRGDMSLVGPRPCTPNEYQDYSTWQKQRFAILPGLTGLWQVSGKNRTTFEEMIQLDTHYMEKCSFWLDLKIMFRTIPVLVVEVHEMLGRLRSKSKDVRLETARHIGEPKINGFEANTVASNNSVNGTATLESGGRVSFEARAGPTGIDRKETQGGTLRGPEMRADL